MKTMIQQSQKSLPSLLPTKEIQIEEMVQPDSQNQNHLFFVKVHLHIEVSTNHGK
jgi:hypothetical protein